uniref:Mitochondrial coenzyme A transporter SLC25A42 n=1 Tax=Schistocephalus solidus TaxID=70667 RepID=A0A0X3PC37_SCHSO
MTTDSREVPMPLQHPASKEHFIPVYSNFIIGGIAGCCAKTTIAPLDRAKINFQTSEMYFNVKALFRFLRESYKFHGFFSLWRGNSATLTRIFPYAAVQYSVHERAKSVLGIHEMDLSHMSLSSVRIRRFVAGCCAGTSSVATTYPLDLARARMAVTQRVKYANLVDVLRSVYREEGIRSLYRGFAPALLGSIPYSGVAFFTFETLKEWRLSRTGFLNPSV